MLQAVHLKKGFPQASSLYCQWIRLEQAEGCRLVAIWIDNEMRAFAPETMPVATTEVLAEGPADEPGGARQNQVPGYTRVRKVETWLS